MSFSEKLAQAHDEEQRWEAIQRAKHGPYDNPDNGCPNCQRYRIMIGEDKKHRCEKCAWCIEEGARDRDFEDYMF